MERDRSHWTHENFKQRITSKEWGEWLLAGKDILIVSGYLRRLKAKNLGAGIVEIYKEPLK